MALGSFVRRNVLEGVCNRHEALYVEIIETPLNNCGCAVLVRV